MPSSNEVKIWPALLALGLVIIGFNLPAINLDYLIHDDSYLYYMYEAGKVQKRIENSASFYPLFPYFEWPLYKLSILFSPSVARWASVLCYALPAACAIYLLHRKIWGMDSYTAFYCAAVPFILPFQTRIPAGLNISYALPSLLGASVLMVTSWYVIITDDVGARRGLKVAYTVVLVLTALYSPNAPFILSVVLGLLICFRLAGNKDVLWMTLVTVALILQRIASAMVTPRPGKSLAFSWENTLERIDTFIGSFMLPFPKSVGSWEVFGQGISHSLVLLIAFLTVLSVFVTGPSLQVRPAHFHRLSPRSLHVFYLFFFLFWAGITALPYLTVVSTAPQPRYFWLAGFGLAPFIPIAINTLLFRVRGRQRALVYRSSLAFLVLVIGVFNFSGLSQSRLQQEEVTGKMRKTFSGMYFPDSSQVVFISDKSPPHPGISLSNLGFLWYAGASRNIAYAMVFPRGDERYWYDPFKSEPQDWWRPPLSGLNASRPLFILKDIDGVVQRVPQLLRVEDGSDHWRVYDLDAEGRIELHAEGAGEEQYLSFLSRNIDRETAPVAAMIAFGDPANRPPETNTTPRNQRAE